MASEERTRVWDPLVRLFHWTTLVAFAIAYFTGEEGSALHIYSGYAILGLILFRIVWGFIGTQHARFADFLFAPAVVLGYVKDVRAGHPRNYLGHNPLGGLMVIALLIGLFVTTATGLVVYAIEDNAGPLAGWVAQDSVPAASGAQRADARRGDGREREEFWEELHELSTNVMLALILLHVAGVVAASRAHGENLTRAMLTGYKRKAL
jgi:cytochrome b